MRNVAVRRARVRYEILCIVVNRALCESRGYTPDKRNAVRGTTTVACTAPDYGIETRLELRGDRILVTTEFVEHLESR